MQRKRKIGILDSNMTLKKIRDGALFFITVIIIGIVSVSVIAYGRGYRLDMQGKSLGTTGLITATSDPVGAMVFVDGKKTTATNGNINVVPGWYTVRIVKEGYQPWEKRIRVQGEVVARADATLFPQNPSLYAVTGNGAVNPTMSPDGAKLAYIIPEDPTASESGAATPKFGVWILDIADKPLGLNRDAKKILEGTLLPAKDSILTWSPDSKELLVTSTVDKVTSYYLLDAENVNAYLRSVAEMPALAQSWKTLSEEKEKEKLLSLKPDVSFIATSSMAMMNFSPDETMVLYEGNSDFTLPPIITPAPISTNPTEEDRMVKPGNLYVYDLKEDRNYLLGKKTDFIESSSFPLCIPVKGEQPNELYKEAVSFFCQYTRKAHIQWLPTSRHLVITGKDRIDIMEFDGGNRKTVYAGPFWNGFVAPWTNGSKLIILTSLNTHIQNAMNLYGVNIK